MKLLLISLRQEKSHGRKSYVSLNHCRYGTIFAIYFVAVVTLTLFISCSTVIIDIHAASAHCYMCCTLSKLIFFQPHALVLDVGCGSGRYLGVRRDVHMVGCDKSENLVAICKDKGHEVTLLSHGTGLRNWCLSAI